MIGRIAAAHRHLPATPEAPALAWKLRGVPVCGSTEHLLDAWLAAGAGGRGPGSAPPRLAHPLAVIARRQRFGHGQQGRVWSSPPGGVWMSAALPWPGRAEDSAAPGLAVAVGLVLQLERLGVSVRLKWPNDLMLPMPSGPPRKLAGLLPGLRLRGGSVRWARVGVGLNARNRVPPGAVALAAVLPWQRCDPLQLAARLLAGLEWAVAWADRPRGVRELAESRLWLPPGPVWWQGEDWMPRGLAADGGLVVERGGRSRVLRRSFEPPAGGPGRPPAGPG